MHFMLIIFVLSTFQLGLGAGEDENSRIYKGQLAQLKDFPYMVSLFKFGGFGCSASMLNPKTVLTAAHCVVWKPGQHVIPAADVTIKYGSNDYEKGTVVKVQKVVYHPKFGIDNSMYNDIALLITEEPLPSSVSHIAIPAKPYPLDTEVHYVGWGLISKEGGPENLLRTAKSMLIPNIKCYMGIATLAYETRICRHKIIVVPNNMTSMIDVIKYSRICVGKPGGSGTCPGDSGGPLVVRSKDGDIAIGVASYLIEDCFEDNMGVGTIQTNVSYYANWIKENADGAVKVINV